MLTWIQSICFDVNRATAQTIHGEPITKQHNYTPLLCVDVQQMNFTTIIENEPGYSEHNGDVIVQ